MIRTRREVAGDSAWEQQECKGDVRLRKIKYMLEKGLKIERHDSQVDFHNAFIEACLPTIYGEEWASNNHRILKILGIEAIRKEVMERYHINHFTFIEFVKKHANHLLSM